MVIKPGRKGRRYVHRVSGPQEKVLEAWPRTPSPPSHPCWLLLASSKERQPRVWLGGKPLRQSRAGRTDGRASGCRSQLVAVLSFPRHWALPARLTQYK